jgi:hypothetical protein
MHADSNAVTTQARTARPPVTRRQHDNAIAYLKA